MRKGERVQGMQWGLVLDAMGAAVRGDRLVLVLHEEVSKNISNRTNNNTWNVKSKKGSIGSVLIHLLVQGVGEH